MRKTWVALLFLVIFTLGISAPVMAKEAGAEESPKEGILLVAFGTSIPAAQGVYEKINRKVKAAFPGVPVCWAYTSRIIRHKLAREGKQLDSPEMALAKMMDVGFKSVAVQSLHTIPGEEYHDLYRNAKRFARMAGGLYRVRIGDPLLAKNEDLIRVTEAIIRHLPKQRKKNEAVVLMGHGTEHAANAFYPAMAYYLQRRDPNIFVGTVEGAPTIKDIKAALLAKKIKKVYLMPFMSVAGDHARNDMAGDEKDSWKSILTLAGITCVPILKGMASYDDIADIWVDHLKTIYTQKYHKDKR